MRFIKQEELVLCHRQSNYSSKCLVHFRVQRNFVYPSLNVLPQTLPFFPRSFHSCFPFHPCNLIIRDGIGIVILCEWHFFCDVRFEEEALKKNLERRERERKSESPLWTMPNISMLWPEVWKKKCGGMRGEAVRRCYGSHGFKVAGITTRTWPFRQSRLATAARSFEKRIRPRVIRFCYARVPIYRGPHAPETDPPIHLPSPRVPRIFASTNPFDSPSPLASIDL